MEFLICLTVLPHVAADYDEGDEDEYENEDEHANHVIGKDAFVMII